MDRIHTHLLERLGAPHTLHAAWLAVQRGGGMAGPDGEGIDAFAARSQAALIELRQELLAGHYQPAPAQRLVRRADPERPLVVPSVRDRVVQRALADLLGGPAEALLHDSAHAYRPGRSPHTAVAALQAAIGTGQYSHVARGDVRKFFDRIDRGRLLALLGKVTGDTRILELIRRLLGAGVLDGARIVDSELGIAQGSPLSPLLSNLYLSGFDRVMAERPGAVFVRYSDDFCVLGSSEPEVVAGLGAAADALAEVGLALREDKTRIVAVQDGFEFVGFALGTGDVQPPLRALDRLVARLEGRNEQDAQAAWQGFAAFYGPPEQWGPLLIERLAQRGDLRTSLLAQRLLGTAAVPVVVETVPHSDSQQRDAERKAAMRFAATLDDDTVAHFLTCFAGDERQHAVVRVDDRGQRRFVSRAGPLTTDLVRRHVAGKETLGSYCFRVDGLVRWLCIDVDATRNALDAPEAERAVALGRAHEDAVALAAAMGKLGAPALVEDSGSKGRHVWVRFERPVAAKLALQLAFAAEATVGAPPEGVRREHFPDRESLRNDRSGPLVKVPWGVHPKSGRRCLFVDPDGEPLGDQRAALAQWPATPLTALQACAELATAPTESCGDAAQNHPANTAVDLTELPLTDRIIKGCAVLGHLVAKVESTGYLDHSERLLVLMALGHVGTEAKSAIHAIISLTSNYAPQKTDRYIATLAPSPVSCGKIRERYPAITRQVPCDCQFRITQGAYPTPLLHAVKPAHVGALNTRLQAKVVPAAATKLAQPVPTVVAQVAAQPAVAVERVEPPRAAVPAAPTPAVLPAAPADGVLAVVQRWTQARRDLAGADAALHALFAGGDRIPCSAGMLVRESGPDGWRYRIDVGDLP